LKFFCALFIFCFALNATELRLNDNLSALSLDENTLFIGTNAGEILHLNLENKELQSLVKLKRVKNFYDESAANIFSIDNFNERLLVLSSSDFGKQKLNLIDKNGILSELELGISGVKKAFFVDENTVLLAFISTEIKLLNLKLKELKSFKFTHSSLSDVRLNEDKSLLVAGFESGEIELFDLKKWQVKSKIATHKDSIYQLDFKQGTLLSCAVDRKIALIKNADEKSKTQSPQISYIDENFLIYACALSPKASRLAYANNNESFVSVLETSDLKPVLKLENLNFMVEYIVFLNEKSLLLAGFSDILHFYEF